MRSRRLILALVAAAVAVAVIVGAVAVAGAGSSTTLPSVTAPELLAQMAAHHDGQRSISGEVSWTNGLFGNLEAASGMAQMPAQSPLLTSGSGRIWVSPDGVRAESQGGGGDQVLVAASGAHGAWVYDSATDKATHIVVKGLPAGAAGAGSQSASPSAITPEVIGTMLQRLAPYGSVEVTGQATVAGRQAYLLRFTPASSDTALGAVQAAIDGKTYVPLRLQVFAAGGTTPVLQYGFDSVSYKQPAASLFTFTPPQGATVVTKTIDASGVAHKGQKAGHAGMSDVLGLARRALLTRAQVQKLVPYKLAWARGYAARPFSLGVVLKDGTPLTAAGTPLARLLGASAGMGGAAGMGTGSAQAGPASALLYGHGLGTIALVQTRATAQTGKMLGQLPSIFGKSTVAGHPAQLVTTPLGGVIVWRQNGTILMAAGMVPASDLTTFATSVR